MHPALHERGRPGLQSLYPSLIRTFEIDPLNLVRPESARPPKIPIVARQRRRVFRRKAILGTLLDDLMPQREEARRSGDAVKSHAIKILMNSFYGVLGTPACRFYDPASRTRSPASGARCCCGARPRIDRLGRRVLYGDTDSLFVESGGGGRGGGTRFGRTLAARLNQELAAHIQELVHVQSRLDLVFDRLYLRFVPARHAARDDGRRASVTRPAETETGPRGGLHGHGGGAQRLDRAPRRRSSASCTRACSPIKRSSRTSSTSSPDARRRAGRPARLP